MTNIVLIPVYSTSLSPNESKSLVRAFDVFNAHKIICFAPNSLKNSEFLTSHFKDDIQYFEDHYFESTSNYSKLLLSEEFYKRFVQFDYMLIYQLDAFVFSDQLNFWAQKGYSYVGPPWINTDWNIEHWIPSKIDFHGLKGYYYKLFSIFKSMKQEQRLYRVGNGGFSLRKIHQFINILEHHEVLVNFFIEKSEKSGLINEDLFWSIWAPFFMSEFFIPGEEVAIKFGVEKVNIDYLSSENFTLPFGIHAWEKLNREFWEEKITEQNEKMNSK